MRTAALLMALAACDPGSEGAVRRFLDDLEPADLTATAPGDWVGVSAPWLFTSGIYYAPSWSEDRPDCIEEVTEDGVTTWRADCDEQDEIRYFGEVVQDDEGVHYHGMGQETDEGCGEPAGARFDGTFVGPAEPAEGVHPFSVTLRVETFGDAGEGCASTDGTTAILYEGTVEWFGEDITGDGVGDDQVFDGAGEYGTTELGRAVVRTREEVIEAGVCNSEAASGATSVEADGHRLEITYDGATDCDGEGTARWSLDGVDHGELTGVYCSTGPGGGASLAGLGVAAALASRRRRGRS